MRRELFDGLYLAGTDYGWPVHPVISYEEGVRNITAWQEQMLD